ncbi:hypothetical protein K437DRAFT_294046 [Tilletiaria anomala UBC 951]|uniref:TAFII55 protein conserved region domain-containing protein n=1 Tax=Tilletiaria anomala (strain ATCC 24038 / CBS 436.72 / UBC 951) TaxID=1037660 RepID=A0A066W5F0_TILAU|nr:uncharacterized protein K437DRAFT_294046 [Tilletiaria anomala UBC 951]KDN47763.1 hypothetical protein K437DRAFT_294046 [Tilletiaria anomala UBC 951]
MGANKPCPVAIIFFLLLDCACGLPPDYDHLAVRHLHALRIFRECKLLNIPVWTPAAAAAREAVGMKQWAASCLPLLVRQPAAMKQRHLLRRIATRPFNLSAGDQHEQQAHPGHSNSVGNAAGSSIARSGLQTSPVLGDAEGRPTASRSSGRHIRPPLKVREARRAAEASAADGDSGRTGYSFRTRARTNNGRVAGSSGRSGSGSSKAPRLKLSLKSSQAGLGTGQGPKTAPYMQGYTRELDSSDDETGEGLAFEEQIILRFPEGPECDQLRDMVQKRQIGEPGAPSVWFKFKDSRRAVVRVGDALFAAKLVDLPTISETHKTLDNRQFFKVADICQMLLVTERIENESEVGYHVSSMGDLVDPKEAEIIARVKADLDAKAKEAGYLVTSSTTATSLTGFDTKDFIYPHGVTPPMNWARERRFRKVIPKRRGQEAVMREVERLLAEDEDAEDVQIDMMREEDAEAELSAEKEATAAEFRGTASGREHPGPDRQGSQAPSDADMSLAATPVAGGEEESILGDGDDEAEGEGSEDGEVDRDLAAALDAVLDEDEDEEASELASVSAGMSGRQSRAESQVDDDDDDDLFDGDDDDASANDEDDEEEDDDDENEEMHEFRSRQRQLAQEIKDIEVLVKRRQEEMDRHQNSLLKERARVTLNKALAELDSKKSQLAEVREERRQAVADMQAEEEEAQARADAAAAAAEMERDQEQRERDREQGWQAAAPSQTSGAAAGTTVDEQASLRKSGSSAKEQCDGAPQDKAKANEASAQQRADHPASAPGAPTALDVPEAGAASIPMDVDEEDEDEEDDEENDDLFGEDDEDEG